MRFLVGLPALLGMTKGFPLEDACHSDDRKGGRIPFQAIATFVILRGITPKNLLQ